uniref:VWFD domain-containing protein n=1 Tax=Callithrix jacchus TaxID=9483 RepID=A0A8I3WAN3_CALJA
MRVATWPTPRGRWASTWWWSPARASSSSGTRGPPCSSSWLPPTRWAASLPALSSLSSPGRPTPHPLPQCLQDKPLPSSSPFLESWDACLLQGTVCGLCGNFDDRSSNDFTTRDHMVVSSELDFGNSWKEAPTCPDVSANPEPCSLNPHRRSWAEKQCSILKSSVFSICHSKVDPTPFYEACVHDSCSCDTGGDCECFCSAVASYAQECTKAEACVFWRTPDLCPVFCDYYNPPHECEWHYEPCGNRSFETCRTINGIHSNISVSYLEGEQGGPGAGDDSG